ncbi:MAG: sulfatase-like hydrolase/transferase [Verrucomicrobia bacterium]|nr:sulfatase-like hydrolase/transferase [Verrucomicrobiota bacterium]
MSRGGFRFCRLGAGIPVLRILLRLAGSGLLVLAGRLPAAETRFPAASQPPNVLLMYVDNVGYGDLGCYGNRAVLTPRIDRLAREGARCTSFYVVTSSCTPSRGALLTGRYPRRNGLEHQLASTENWVGIGLPHRERLLPEYLKGAGYATGCFGKWNIGFAPGSRPTERGFDEFLGFRSGNIGYDDHLYNGEYDVFRGTELHPVKGYATDLWAEAAIDFIARHAARPWFVYLPFNAAHFVNAGNVPKGQKPVWPAPAAALARYGWPADEADEKRRYLAVLTALDDAIGRVLDRVDALGLRDRTLVAFISDNGAFMLPGRGREVASNAPLRDGGTTCYEGGVRVPAIFRWPGRIPAGREVGAMLSHLDVVPLCLEVSGASALPGRVLDGRSPLPALASGAASPHARLFFAYDQGLAVREERLKLVRQGRAPWELYDLAEDPGEARNLAAARPAEVTRLAVVLADWEREVRRDASPPATRPGRKQK